MKHATLPIFGRSLVRFIILPPITMLLTAALMVALDRYAPILHMWRWPASGVGIVFIVLGIGIAQWHARLFERIGANIQTFGEPSAITRAGLFSRTRNPMYLGFVLALSGVAIVLGSLTPLAALLAYAALAQWWYIPFEERAMLRKFGAEYQSYCAEVRRWL